MWSWQSVKEVPVELLNRRMKQLQSAIEEVVLRLEGVVTWTDGDTTPSVRGGRVFATANTGATSVTQFDNGRPGQTIVVVFGDNNTTLVHGASLVLTGGANLVGTTGYTRQFVSVDGTVFRQLPLG